MFTFFTRIFKYSWCSSAANYSEFIELYFFVVDFSENHRIFLDGSMGKMIGRGISNILLFILYCEG